MVRPRICRHVRLKPVARLFKPQGIPARRLKTALLREEELEAIFLSDYRGLEQEEAAALMNVSRSTFSRTLASARKAVATALAEGRALRIGGGDFRFVRENCRFFTTLTKRKENENACT